MTLELVRRPEAWEGLTLLGLLVAPLVGKGAAFVWRLTRR